MRLALRYYRPAELRIELVILDKEGRSVPVVTLTPEEAAFARLMGTELCKCGCGELVVAQEVERALFK